MKPVQISSVCVLEREILVFSYNVNDFHANDRESVYN